MWLLKVIISYQPRHYNLCNLWCTDGDDYSGGKITVNVSTGMISQSFVISIIEDDIVECSETFGVTIASVSSCGIRIGNNNNIKVMIADNDSK